MVQLLPKGKFSGLRDVLVELSREFLELFVLLPLLLSALTAGAAWTGLGDHSCDSSEDNSLLQHCLRLKILSEVISNKIREIGFF